MNRLITDLPSKALFRDLAHVAQNIMQTRDQTDKIDLCATYFKQMELEADLHRAAQFLGEGAFPAILRKRASLGSRTISTAAADFCEIDYELVFKPSKKVIGNASETIEKLMRNIEAARTKRSETRVTLGEVENIFERLCLVSSRVDKREILWEAFTKLSPVEIKYFLRILRQGSLRIGFEAKSVMSSLAHAFNHKIEDVSYVHMITGSIGKTATLCRSGELEYAQFKLFNPISYMLASPVEARSVEDISNYLIEEMFDGMRCQLHVSTDKVKLFSRDQNNVTVSFPEIPTQFINKDIKCAVLDGQLCVYKNETIQPIQQLEKRMGVKKPTQKLLSEYPVIFIAFDILYNDGEALFNLPLDHRRKYLQMYAKNHGIAVSRQFEADSLEQLDELFDRSVQHGNEGLILKKRGSVYEYGQRRENWLKIKKQGGLITTVMMYAHTGSGKRGDIYSDFTLGVRVKEDDRYEEDFIPIGKVHGGYTDNELEKLYDKIKELTVEKYGPTLGLLPELVIELEFDSIQLNKRTKANYKLRSPFIRDIKWNLGPEDVDTLKDVERIYQETIDQKRKSQHEYPSLYHPK